jgi:tetratricopeptide (TPR) repeat protein
MWLLLGLCAALAAPSVVHAQTIAPTVPQKPTKPMIDAAERYFRDGVRFTEEGNYDAARVSFEAGYKLSGEPDFLHNLSWTAERQGQLGDAIGFAQRYLAAKPDAEDAGRTRSRIERMRSQMGQTAPSSQPAPVQATAAQPVAATAPALPQNEASGPTSPAKASGRGKVPPAAIGLLAGGGALTLAGVGCLAGAWTTGQQAQASGVTYDEWATLSYRGQALNTTGLSLAVVGGAVVVAGGVWAIVGRRPAAEQPEIAE